MYAKHGKLRQPHCRLTALPRGTSKNNYMHIDLHFAAHTLGLSSLNFFWWAVRKTKLFLQEQRFSRSRSSNIIDIGTNRKRVCDFLLVRHSNLGPLFHRFGDIGIAVFCASDVTPIPP